MSSPSRLRTALVLGACLGLAGLSGCAFGEPKPTTDATLTTATLHGNVYSSFDGTTEYWWQYGGTTAYGSQTTHRSIAIHDEDPHAVSEPVSGLAPDTTYHYQLCARDGEETPPRTNCSKDQTLSTASAIGSSRIAFLSFRDGNAEIYSMAPDAGDQVRLTNDPMTDEQPAWSPDATKIAFYSDRHVDTAQDVFVMNADGGSPTRLTGDPATDWQPTWSPNGGKIAFARGDDSNSEIFSMNADGGGQTNLTHSDAYENSPAWSPDGTKIAFVENSDIYVMPATGGAATNITDDDAGSDGDPEWSPDGTKIAYSYAETAPDPQIEIYSMDPDGDNKINLTNNAGHQLDPTWSPDGRKIAYWDLRGGLWVMDADGSDQVSLGVEDGAQPAWSRVPAAPALR